MKQAADFLLRSGARVFPRGPLVLVLASVLSQGCDQAPAGSKSEAVKVTEPSGAASDRAPGANAPGSNGSGGTSAGLALLGTGGTAASAASPTEVTSLVLLEAGTGEKKALSYKFTAGQTKQFSMKMLVSVSMMMNGQAMPGGAPMEIAITGTALTKEVRPDGGALRELTFGTFTPKIPNMPPQAIAQLDQQMAVFKGMKLLESISPKGTVEHLQADAAMMANPQAQQLLQNLKDGMSNALLPLPKEEIGVGARWEDRRQITMNGLSISQVGSFKLTKVKGDTITIEVTIKQTAKPGEVVDPRMPPGSKTEILAMEGNGTGSVTANLVTLNVDSTIKMSNQVETKVTGVQPGMAPPTDPMGASAAPGAASSVRTTMSTTMELTMKLAD